METETPLTDSSSAGPEPKRSGSAAPRSVIPGKKRVKRRRVLDGFTRHGLRTLLALLFLLIGAIGYGAFRLSKGPVPLNFALEPLQKAMSAMSGQTIRMREAALSWDSTSGDLGLDLHGVSMSTPEGNRLLTLPTAWLEFSGLELLRGRFQPTVLRLNGLTLLGRRSETGQFALGIEADNDAATLGPPAEIKPDASDTRSPTQILTDVLQLGRPNGLRQVRLRETRVILMDERMNVEWRVNDLSATLQADPAGNPLGGMEGTLILPGRITHLTLFGKLDLADRQNQDDDVWTVKAEATDLMPSLLAARIPGLAELSGLELPTQVNAQAVLDSTGYPQALSAQLKFGEGRLVHEELPTGTLPVAGGDINIGLQNNRLDIEIKSLTVGNGTGLTGKIALDKLQFPIQVEANLGLKALTLADLPTLWPESVAPNPRRWIFANLSKGGVSEASATVKAVLPARGGEPDIQQLTASLKAANIDVIYLGKLPPVEGVDGSLTYTHSDGRLAMTLQDGRVRGGLTVPNGTVTITGLNAKDQHMALTMAIDGPVSEALSLLDQPPLGFMKRFGIDPKQSQGTAHVDLKMGFPLLDALKVEQLEIAADATLTDAALRNVIEDVSLSEAALALKLTPKGLSGSGTGKLNGVGFQIGWTESFTGGGRSLSLAGTVDNAGRAALKLPGEGYLNGPVDLTVAYTESKPKQAKVQVKADLTRTRIEVADILYVKPPGESAQGTAELVMENNRLTQIAAFDYRTATDRHAEGSVQFDSRMDISQAVLRRVQMPGIDLAATVKRGRDGWIVGLDARTLDLTPFLADRAKQPPDAKSTPLSLAVSGTVDKLVLGPNREASGVKIRLEVVRDVWNVLGFTAKVGNGNVSTMIAGDGNARRLTLEATDAGAFFAFAGVIETVRGGVLTVTGQPDAEGWRGQVKMTAYRLLEEPVLGRILAIASITGIPELLGGEGIAFESATLDYRLSLQKITIANGRTTGLSVGFKLDGTVDRTTERLNLFGTLVPMAGINRVISAIPLLGTLLTGGEGGGIFAWTFTVTGPMADPQVSVNPLSGFAPGILRSIFEGGSSSSEGGGATQAPPPLFNPGAGDR